MAKISEKQIIKHWNIDGPTLVSVACITYNHELYIKDALDGFLMQETDFPFEIVVHDDASTDATRAIVEQYVEDFPNIIRPIFQKENQLSKGIDVVSLTISNCRGEYVALCEGDDYWIDNKKLKLQCDLLAANPDLSLVFHNAKLKIEGSTRNAENLTCSLDKDKFITEDVVVRNWFIPTHSMFFRKSSICLPEWFKYVYGKDYALQLLLSLEGNIYYINQVMGVYRVNPYSFSTNKPGGFSQVKKIQTLSYFNVHTDFKYNDLIDKRIALERNLIYTTSLFSRPWYVRLLSLDYYLNKFKNQIPKLKLKLRK